MAHYARYISPPNFGPIKSLNLVIMNVIGGMNTLIGPLIGAFFLVLVPELLRGYVQLQHVIFGIVLIVVMAFMPGGMAEPEGRVALHDAPERPRVMTALLEVKDLSRSFDGLKAVSELNFTRLAGDIFGIIGPNGAGKTTAVNLVSGVIKPTTGAVASTART